jgi:hypothetical protein
MGESGILRQIEIERGERKKRKKQRKWGIGRKRE